LFDSIFLSYSCFLWYIAINLILVSSSIAVSLTGAPDPALESFTIILVF
jgi:hypothetical protein